MYGIKNTTPNETHVNVLGWRLSNDVVLREIP